MLEDIGTKVFPYTDFPFLEYSSNESYLKITQIKKVDYDQINEKYIIFYRYKCAYYCQWENICRFSHKVWL